MNIGEAKEQIRRSVSIYLMKDKNGCYRIPLEKQRPIFLYGAPGIGKTAIMEQIAREMNLSLVSYSMTHHTRQSALGLPFIVQKEYQGETYDISRYTMSEIIASVYDKIEETGKQEGILFLDEINCVSETLAPSMLQFLQYKVFGTHRVPDGWVIVTAGNPPEFNRSVREFDVVTMDRLKVLEVVPDFDSWRNYAVKKGLHKAIVTYLDIKKEDFYQIESTIDGKTYVTARGWEDLSEAIFLYEEQGFPVDETLVSQYLHNNRILGEFSAYYDLFRKYRTDYQIGSILKGVEDRMVRTRAQKASFDEKITVVGLLLEALMPKLKRNMETEAKLKAAVPVLREKKQLLTGCSDQGKIRAFQTEKKNFDASVMAMKAETESLKKQMSNIFRFVFSCFGTGNEMLILITELTVNYDSARFIAEKGCKEYFEYDKNFLLYERNQQLSEEIRRMEEQGMIGEPDLNV